MADIKWLSHDVVVAIHRRQLAEHGGGDGVRDEGLLASALKKPQNLHHYGDPEPDIAALAASYAYGLCRNHPFVDGNKRTALVICRVFLKINGYDLTASGTDKYKIFMALAAGELSEDALAEWIRDALRTL